MSLQPFFYWAICLSALIAVWNKFTICACFRIMLSGLAYQKHCVLLNSLPNLNWETFAGQKMCNVCPATGSECSGHIAAVCPGIVDYTQKFYSWGGELGEGKSRTGWRFFVPIDFRGFFARPLLILRGQRMEIVKVPFDGLARPWTKRLVVLLYGRILWIF